jgi:hypothetical protein
MPVTLAGAAPRQRGKLPKLTSAKPAHARAVQRDAVGVAISAVVASASYSQRAGQAAPAAWWMTGEPDGYLHSEDIDGSKSFGVWPLSQAAKACFSTPEWPAARPVPQASIEFEVADADSVQVAAEELTLKGVHPAPWGACPAVGADRRSTPITRGSDHRRLVRARAAAVARNTMRPVSVTGGR